MAFHSVRRPDSSDQTLPQGALPPNDTADTKTIAPSRRASASRVLSERPGDEYYLPYLAVRAAVDQKGLDVRAIDVSEVTNIADIFVIVSGTSERHVESLSDKIRASLGAAGEHPHGSSGSESAQWVILDYGNLVVHIFYEPTRQHYRFDELWEKGVVLSPPPSLEKEMRMLRTGIYR